MAVTYAKYRVTDNLGKHFDVSVPRWDGVIAVTRGEKTVNDYLYEYPDCPVNATWFCGTIEQAAEFKTIGFTDVYAIKDLVDSGITEWYFNQKKTVYLKFLYDQQESWARAYMHFDNNDRYGIGVNLTPNNDGAHDNHGRYTTMFSDTIVDESDDDWRLWAIQNCDARENIIWSYYYEYLPRTGPLIDYNGHNFWEDVEPFTPDTSVSIPVQWKSSKYGKTYQDSFEINVSN